MTPLPPSCAVLPTLQPDCRHYRGDRPCRVGVQGVCPANCAVYEPQGFRILIIKLGALGDVIRTAALLPGLKSAHPDSHVTWVTRHAGTRALANHPQVDRLLTFDAESLAHLELEHFDLCLSLDKEPGPAALAMRVHAADKRGVGLSAHGTPIPLNPECAHYFALGLDDVSKFIRNNQSYQALVYGAVGLPYHGEPYRLYPGPGERRSAVAALRVCGVDDEDVLIGLNTGAGKAFANKNLTERQYIRLAERLAERKGARIVLLGGAAERERNARIAAACPAAVNPGCDFDPLEFAALVERCAVVVTGDTMAMHVAIGCGVAVVAVFGPTCPQEIDLFGRGERIVSPAPCGPCYRRTCDVTPSCMEQVELDDVVAAVERWLGGATRLPVLPVRMTEVTV